MKPTECLLTALLALYTSSSTAAKRKPQTRRDNCPLWLAPSNLNTDNEHHLTKYGLFAGQEYPQNATLPFPELVIPLVDMFGDFHREDPVQRNVLKFLEDLLWAPRFLGGQWEGNISTPALIPGIGTLSLYHSTYSNVEFLQAAVLKREPMVGGGIYPESGQAHLLRGAITPYYNATLQATERIPAGMELFADFGSEWDGNFTENIYQDKIHRYDYEIADNLVDALIGLLDKFPDLSLGMQEDIMDFMLQKVLRTAAGANAKTITSLIPDNPRKLKRVKEVGGTFMYRYQDMIKSNKWLHENGFCLDAIRQGPSKIPNAGRGAFATRDIARGETITVSPMVHIADSDLMEMYPILTLKEGQTTKTVYDQEDDEQPMEMQILLNYVFGHPESSLLLVPVGPHVTLINHGGKKANAYITWAGKKDDIIENGKVYMDYSVEALSTIREVVFNMKIVALTNIKEGDEITLDYGDSWQQAWNKYQAEFKEVLEGTEHPLKADDLKAMYKDKPFETVATLKENPYPENVHLACFLETEERPDGTLMTHQKHGWDIVQFSDPVDYDDFDGQTFYRVHALDREEAPGHFYNYTVRARISHAADGIEDVHNVPHDACTFVDMPYTSDIHLPWAFRHFIEIKDSHFPINWRDLRLAEE